MAKIEKAVSSKPAPAVSKKAIKDHEQAKKVATKNAEVAAKEAKKAKKKQGEASPKTYVESLPGMFY